MRGSRCRTVGVDTMRNIITRITVMVGGVGVTKHVVAGLVMMFVTKLLSTHLDELS